MSESTKSPWFPDCTIHHMEQRTPEWHEIRKDKLTGSSMGAWLAERPQIRATVPEIKAALNAMAGDFKKSSTRPELLDLCEINGVIFPKTHLKATSSARHTAICKILGNLSGCEVPDQWEIDPNGDPPRNPALWAVWNGLRLESEALESFQEWSGLEAEEVGFCVHSTGASGCSPDSLIKGNSIGFEGKAPLPATHVRYLLDGGLPETYRDQVHGNMAVTGATGWWFQSYCPGLPTHRYFEKRSEYTESMAKGMEDFAESLQSAREEIGALWVAPKPEAGGAE